jgi:hypothetical protein
MLQKARQEQQQESPTIMNIQGNLNVNANFTFLGFNGMDIDEGNAATPSATPTPAPTTE